MLSASLEDLDNGVTRRVLANGGTIMAAEVSFEKEAIDPLHHPHEQLTYRLSGRFAFTIDGETREVGAGDTLYKKPDGVHGGVCPEPGVQLDIFTPQREDLLLAKLPARPARPPGDRLFHWFLIIP